MDDEKFARMKAQYQSHILRKILFIALCVVFVLIAIVVSINIGAYEISFADVYKTIIDHILGKEFEPYSKEWYDNEIVWNTRMPRISFAILAGIGLAISGATMQSIMKNPLAEPYTTGVSSGAYFGVAISMVLGFTMLPVLSGAEAFIFALVPVAVILIILPRSNNSVATIILIGTALSYMFNAFTTLILVSTDADTLANVYRWQVGSFANVHWDDVYVVAAVVIIGTIIIYLLSNRLNIMMMGDQSAQSLGINVKTLRLACMVIMAIMVAAIVTFSGIIGFIGLICPHIVRLIIGSDNRFVIPAGCAFGAAFLLFADTLSKWLSGLDSVPVGAVCSLMGAPLFLMLLITNRRQIWR